LSELAEKFVSALVEQGDAAWIVRHPEVGTYLSTTPSDSALYGLIEDHLKAYGKLPSRQTITEMWGAPLPKADEDPRYYLDKLIPMHVERTLRNAVLEANGTIKTDPGKSLEVLETAVHGLRALSQGMSVIDLREAKDFIMKHIASKWGGVGSYGMGWPAYDEVSGGLMPGDVVSIVGRPGLGKTMLLLSRAFHFWKVSKVPVVFISMEMMLGAILERAAAMHASVPLDFIKKGVFPNVHTNLKEKLVTALDEASKAEVPFHFVDGNMAVNADDVLRICSQLQPSVLIVDGAYLIGLNKHRRQHENIGESIGFLKQSIATSMEIPVMATYQFNRDAQKLKKGEPSGLEHIAGSDEIGRLSSVVLGLFQNDTPETIHRRKVNVMKGRSGEVGSFYVNWDFVSMDFGQVADPSEEGDLEIL
jgi:replicative DNA helicase